MTGTEQEVPQPQQPTDLKVGLATSLVVFFVLLVLQWQMSRNRAALAAATADAAKLKEDLIQAREEADHKPALDEARELRERIADRKERLDEIYRKMDRLDAEHVALAARADEQRRRAGKPASK